jgi:hypothetical protein
MPYQVNLKPSEMAVVIELIDKEIETLNNYPGMMPETVREVKARIEILLSAKDQLENPTYLKKVE